MEFTRLIPHPSTPAPAIEVEAVALILATGALSFRYLVQGDIQKLRLPSPGPASRMDELWRHTCFEAFVKPRGAERYFELNFAPSSAWAAYSFESYRLGMQPLAGIKAPSIRCETKDETFTLNATISMKSLRFDSLVGLSAVIEDRDGGVSYWAISHPQPKADFHDADAWTGGFKRFTAEAR